MLLTQAQVIQLVQDPIDPIILINKKVQDNHKVHIQADGYKTVLNQIIGYETVEAFNAKKILHKPFTRPLLKKIMKSQSRWKTARGTQKFYNFRTDSEKYGKDFADNVLSKVWKGKSMSKFVKDFLSKAIYEEFNGFFLVERGKLVADDAGNYYEIRDGVRKPVANPTEKLVPYICFKSVDDVYKFKVVGETVEFIVLDFGKTTRQMQGEGGMEDKEVQLYRVIDDKYDYILEKVNGEVKFSTEYKVIEHKAGQCPVSCVTFINENLTDDRTKTSPVDDVIQLLDYYLHVFAEHLITEVLHAHPIYYQVGTQCSNKDEHGIACEKGWISGEYDGKTVHYKCTKCEGTGHNLKKDSTSVIILPAEDSEGKAFNMSNPAGYVTTDVDILDYQQRSIDWLENKILEAALGTKTIVTQDITQKTATEAIINIKPLEDIINEIIDVLETVETNLTNFIGKMYYGDTYLGCEILNGRQLSIKDENTIISEQKEAKAVGVSSSFIRSSNEELIYSKYSRSPIELQRNVLFLNLEPLIGYTIQEVQSNQNVPDDVKVLKVNFNDFIVKFENEHGNILEYKKEMTQEKRIPEILGILIKYAQDYATSISDKKKEEQKQQNNLTSVK